MAYREAEQPSSLSSSCDEPRDFPFNRSQGSSVASPSNQILAMSARATRKGRLSLLGTHFAKIGCCASAGQAIVPEPGKTFDAEGFKFDTKAASEC